MNLEALKAPFPEDHIEWRIGQSGVKGNGQVWAKCLAYVQARAVMDRLDESVGPENWRAEYTHHLNGVMCRLSLRVTLGDWVTKEDGADLTDIEPFKGGISSALKRAAVLWGIGRYLYDLESGFAQIVERGAPGARYAKTKDGKEFYWVPPALPVWALPQAQQKEVTLEDRMVRAVVKPVDPGHHNGAIHHEWTFPVGKLAKRRPQDCDTKDLEEQLYQIENKYADNEMPARTAEAHERIVAELTERELAFNKKSGTQTVLDFDETP